MTKNILFISLILLGLTQISIAQKAVTPAKKKLAAGLTAQTVSLYPIQFFEDSFAKMNTEKSAELEKSISDDLLGKLEKSSLTAEEKEAIKPRIAAFTQKISSLAKNALMKDLKIRNQFNKSLETKYLQVFTVAELQKLDRFFKTADGQAFVRTFNRKITGKLEGSDTAGSDSDERDFENLVGALGEKITVKFMDSLVLPVMDDVNKYIEVWGKQMLKNLENETTKGSIKKEMDRFLTENFTN